MAASVEKILARLRELLAESDLQTTTEKMLRKKLEEEFKVDMMDKKPIIRKEIERYLADQEGEEEAEEEAEEEEEEQDDKPRKKRGAKLGCILSEPLQKFLGEKTLARTEVVKRLWDYIKANNLQDPKDRRKILLDAKLKTIFTSPMTMFTMNSQLTKHCFTDDVIPGSPAGGEKRQAASEKAKPAAKKAKVADADAGGKGEKTNNFNKPLPISKELARWTGKAEMSRPEVISHFWKYVKEHKLQDASDKRMVKCDATLKELTGEDSFMGFSASKYFAKHFVKG